MAGDVTMEITGIAETVARFGRADDTIKQAVVDGLNELGTLGAGDLREAMPRDSTYMATHVSVDDATVDDPVVTIHSAAIYTAVQDQGRSQGWFPPVAALMPWASRHQFADTIEATAFLTARAISRRGLPPKNFIDPVIQPLIEKAQSMMSSVLSGVDL